MTERVVVEFQVTDKNKFMAALQQWDDQSDGDNGCVSFRADDYVSKRQALVAFVDAMELTLRRHEHKTTWRERPIEALIKLMMLEIEEFRISHDFFEVKESRKELVDIGNYAMILWDRLGMLNQDINAHAQEK